MTAGRSKDDDRSCKGRRSVYAFSGRCAVDVRSHYSYDTRRTTERLHYEQSQTFSLNRCTVAVYSVYSLSTVERLAFRLVQKHCDLRFGVTARRRLNATMQRSPATKPNLKSPNVAVKFDVTGVLVPEI